MSQSIEFKRYQFKLDLAKYYGFIMYSIYNIKLAHEDLSKYNKALNLQFQTSKESAFDLNELGRLDRVLKDYIILKIAAFFDKDYRTLSLIQLKNLLLRDSPNIGKESVRKLVLIENIFKKEIDIILTCRHQVVAHSEKNKFDNLIHTQVLLGMPIVELLDEINDLVEGLEILLKD